MAITAWDLYEATKKYDGSPTAHADVIATLKKNGHTAKESDAWCTETVMSMFFDAGDISVIGGYASASGGAKKNAQKIGIWHDGSKSILPMDVVLFGKNGDTNHTELALGNDLNISGNYNGGCSRRKRSGRSSDIIGYIRPKFAKMSEMDNFQATILACECILGTFGSGDTRKNLLSVFGEKNIEIIQKEVDRIWNDNDKVIFDLAVYTITGHAGKNSYRKIRLGKYADAVQKKINAIDTLKGRTVKQTAQDVIDGLYGNTAVRKYLLNFNGYNADEVQKEVNTILASKDTIPVCTNLVGYTVSLTTKVDAKTLPTMKTSPRPIIVIEPEDYTSDEVQAIRKKGYRVLAYLSLGTNEKSRSWFSKYQKLNLQQLEDWPDEYYADVRKSEWRDHLVETAKKYKAQGYDGFWLDNLDVYEYNKSDAMYNACYTALEKVKAVGGYIMVNGGSEFFDRFMEKDTKNKGFAAVNGVTQEEVYSLITNYSKKNNSGKKGIFGEQTADMHKWYKSYMKNLKKHGFETFLLEYTESAALMNRIIDFCTKYGMTGVCISSDVDL